MPVEQIITGGQTGVDRAAMDVALELGIPLNGWCPKGRLAEDGPIAPKYPLRETATADYAERTRLNVQDSDGILVVTRGKPAGGTALGIQHARRLGKPVRVVDLEKPIDVRALRTWLTAAGIRRLGIGGPRESRCVGISAEAKRVLKKILAST